jgi:hypothetical protein
MLSQAIFWCGGGCQRFMAREAKMAGRKNKADGLRKGNREKVCLTGPGIAICERL